MQRYSFYRIYATCNSYFWIIVKKNAFFFTYYHFFFSILLIPVLIVNSFYVLSSLLPVASSLPTRKKRKLPEKQINRPNERFFLPLCIVLCTLLLPPCGGGLGRGIEIECKDIHVLAVFGEEFLHLLRFRVVFCVFCCRFAGCSHPNTRTAPPTGGRCLAAASCRRANRMLPWSACAGR